MLSKIISGGQNGVEQAALDGAIELDISCGGWIANGRRTELDPLPPKYHLQERPSSSDADVREWNVIDSDGTLVISRGILTGGPALTRDMAVKYERPCLHIDLERMGIFFAVSKIVYWIHQYNIDVLNIAGPSTIENPEIYRDTVKLLKAIFYVDIRDLYFSHPDLSFRRPGTVKEAVDRLISELTFKDRIRLARMEEIDVSRQNNHIRRYIEDYYGLWRKDSALMQSCRSRANAQDIDAENASAIIIHELWKKLKKTHALRIVPVKQGKG